MGQLELVMSFINDLLDLKTLQTGAFTLINESFDVTSLI